MDKSPTSVFESGAESSPCETMPDFLVLERKQHESARVWGYRVLLYNIVRLHLPPGSCLVESEVRQLLDVSRTPIREALMQLSQEGFVTIIPQKGTYVALIDMEQVLDLRYVRSCVEARTIYAACANMTVKAATELQACLARQRLAAQSRNFEEFMKHDDAMHKLIFVMAGKPGVWDIFDKNNLHHFRSRILGLHVGRTPARLVTEHEVIVDALIRGDAKGAEAGVLAHLAASAWNADEVLEKFPEYIVPPRNALPRG